MKLSLLLVFRRNYLYKRGFHSISNFQKKTRFHFKTNKTPEKYLKNITLNGFTSTLIWGSSAILGALLFFQGIPRIRTQIHQQLPILGASFDTEIHPSDSPV